MSVINQMLQDLDRRSGAPAADALPTGAVKPVKRVEGRREWFWRIVAALLILATAWVIWVAWQLQPRRLVTDEALRAGSAARRPVAQVVQKGPVPVPAPAPAPVTVAKPEPAVAAAPIVQPPPPVAPAQPIAAAPAALKPDPPKAVTAPAAAVAEKTKVEPPVTRRESPPKAEMLAAPAAARPAPPAKLGLDVPQARILPSPAPRVSSVEKRDLMRGPAERAEAEFRRAVALLNQARVSEAEDAFSAALSNDPTHEGARQSLVSLLFERNRIEDARRVLQEGLAINPSSAPFAIGLARLFAERRDYAGALKVLKGAQTTAANRADYHALLGTILQRMGRNKESVDAYANAVRIAPASGTAWVGMAISLEALELRAEAADAFKRAIATGTLTAEVRDFAEQRARNLQ